LAANTPLPDSRPLGIDDPNVKKSTWNGPAPPPETNGTGTTLNTIQPIAPAARTGMDPVHGMTVLNEGKSDLGQGTPADSYQQLLAELNQRGMTVYRQERAGDSVKFTCTIPNRENPDKARTYQATGKNEVAALRAVLERIDGPK
jgi:hypothetical protein